MTDAETPELETHVIYHLADGTVIEGFEDHDRDTVLRRLRAALEQRSAIVLHYTEPLVHSIVLPVEQIVWFDVR